jgi:hypothetical protein
MPYEWGNAENESTEERFAEAWGRVLLTENQAAIIEKSRALQTAKVNQIWQKCQQHRFDLIKAFKSLKAVSSEKVCTLLEARLSLYNGFEPENYSLPYTMDQIKEQLRYHPK